MSKANQIVDRLLEVQWNEPIPPKQPFDGAQEEIAFHARQPFTAYEYALDHGHNPLLWQSVKGTAYERPYRAKFNVGEARSPQMKTLKANRTELDDDERRLVMKRGAVWHHGKNGKPTPAVWKSVIRDKTYFVCNTHRAAAVKPTLKAAIRAFDFIKTTS